MGKEMQSIKKKIKILRHSKYIKYVLKDIDLEFFFLKKGLNPFKNACLP